jgi:hypothetical protein
VIAAMCPATGKPHVLSCHDVSKTCDDRSMTDTHVPFDAARLVAIAVEHEARHTAALDHISDLVARRDAAHAGLVDAVIAARSGARGRYDATWRELAAAMGMTWHGARRFYLRAIEKRERGTDGTDRTLRP